MTGTVDLYHVIGGDLSLSGVGDLLTVSDTEKGKQRVLRRLLTPPGSYIWNPDYGAGLQQKIGQPFDAAEITALIRSQIFLEQCVARTPDPVITLSDVGNGSYNVTIQYTDANTAIPVVLSFDPGSPPGTASG